MKKVSSEVIMKEHADRRSFLRRMSLAAALPSALSGAALRKPRAALFSEQGAEEANQNTIPAADRRDIVVYRDRFAYCSHACMVRLANGEWVAAFTESQLRDPYLHPPSDPHFRNLLSRSSDQGRTWSVPQVVPNWDWYGVEVPGIAQLGDGTVVLNQWRFLWYPLNLGKKLAAEGQKIWLNTGRGWKLAGPEAEWSESAYPWVRANGGCFVHLSSDGGRTWKKTVKIDTSPYIGGFTPRGVVQLSDGTVLMCTADHPINRQAFAVHSQDGGRSWGTPILIAERPPEDFSEPTAVVLPGDRVVTLIRDDDVQYLFQVDSPDGGRSWGPARQTPIWGYPAHLLRLSDTRLLATYGHRRSPYGIRACLSQDDGRTWDYGREIVIRDDFPNRNLGYPVTIEYAPGHLFTIYYGEDGDGITCIQGSYWKVA